jgi:hypothetical protein
MIRCLSCQLAAAVLLSQVALSTFAADKPATGLAVDKTARTVTIPAVVAPRKLPNLKEIYPIEVIATFPAPKGQKAHETVVNFTVKPSEVHKALESLGLKAGKPILGEGKPTGPGVEIFLEVPRESGTAKKVPIEETMVDMKTGKPLPRLNWLFTGSDFKFPDPEKDDKVYGADQSGTLITIFPVTNDTVFQTDLPIKLEKDLKLETNPKALPKIGTPVKIIIQAK